MGLRLEELTGSLASLADPKFFRKVFIEFRAVAWPDEIGLAPDAMYAGLASQDELTDQAGPIKSQPELKATLQD